MTDFFHISLIATTLNLVIGCFCYTGLSRVASLVGINQTGGYRKGSEGILFGNSEANINYKPLEYNDLLASMVRRASGGTRIAFKDSVIKNSHLTMTKVKRCF